MGTADLFAAESVGLFVAQGWPDDSLRPAFLSAARSALRMLRIA